MPSKTTEELEQLHELISALASADSAPSAELVRQIDDLLKSVESAWNHIELERDRFMEQLARAARLSELGIMVAAVFHEMSQPLLGIKGFVELMIENLKKGETGKITEWAKEIRAQTLRMQEMQKNVSNFLHRDMQPGEPVSLHAAVNNALRLFQHRMRSRKVKVNLELSDDLPLLNVSQLQLVQVLVNLIGNALQATEGQDREILSLSASTDEDSNMVTITLTDNGPGIPADHREQIFEPFFTTKQEKGTGLGLYISKTLAQANNGDLRLGVPKTGRGTVFELDVPSASPAKSPAELKAAAKPKTPEEAPPKNALQTLNQQLWEFAQQLEVPRTVLIVDDEPVILKVLSEYLKKHEIQSDVAATAEEGLEKLAEASYAVLLADKNLPKMDGIELLQKAKAQWPQMEVVMITGFTSVESALDAIGEGAFDYIPKPFPSLSYVAEKVRGAMARHDFEARIHAMVDYLSSTVKAHLSALAKEQQADWVQRLRATLQTFNQKDVQGHVVVIGPENLAKGVEGLGHRMTRAFDLEDVAATLEDEEVHLVVFAEGEGGIEGSEAVRRLHGMNPDLGVFVIAQRASLKHIVSAIGIGVGDYIVRPLESRELFAPRLARLVARQQHITRYRRLLESLKKMNIDLLVSRTSESGT
jgi:signal transduction histidine kinase/DNA-binding response OmpR family regulator